VKIIKRFLLKLYKGAEKHKEISIRKELGRLPPKGIFLDVGCWDGRKTLWWAKAARAKTVLGIEMVEYAAKRAKNKNIEVFVTNIDKEKWPIKDNSIDCVFSNLLIEHLGDIDRFISESYRVLKRGELTVVSTNNLSSWHNIAGLLFGWAPFDMTNSSSTLRLIGNPLTNQKNDSFFGESWCHKCIYTIRWLKQWYELYGFRLERVRGSGYYPLPAFLGNIDKTHAAFIILAFKKV